MAGKGGARFNDTLKMLEDDRAQSAGDGVATPDSTAKQYFP